MKEMTAEKQIEYIRAQRRAISLRRREREKKWLSENGFTSWESLHTKLMKGEIKVKEPRKAKEPQ